MQNKRTEILELDELPELTPRQEAFALGILEGRTASDAYRAAYDVSGMADASIWCAASKLKSNYKVKQWLSLARAHELERGKLTHEEFLRRLLALAERAELSGNLGAAVNAVVNAGKSAGHMVERHENVNETRKLKDLEQRLAQITGGHIEEEEQRVH